MSLVLTLILVIFGFLAVFVMLWMIAKFWVIKYAEVDMLDILKAKNDLSEIYRLVEKKMLEKAILMCWMLRRFVEKILNNGLIPEKEGGEIILDIEETIKEIGEIDSLDGMPIGFLVFDEIRNLPPDIQNEIKALQKQQAKFRFIIRLFNFAFPYEIYH